MKNKMTLAVYSSNGEYQGYLSHISMTKAKIETTPDRKQARGFSSIEAANKAAQQVSLITNMGLYSRLV